jgi:hypothetical protein
MAKKEAGGRSSQQNDFLQPNAPLNVTATDVGTNRAYNDAALTVTWTIDALSPAALNYTVYNAATNAQVGTGTLPTPVSGVYTAVVGGLLSATSYSIYVTLSNNAGVSTASASTTGVTVTSVPDAPSAPVATSTVADQDHVTWTAPATGGSGITMYYWESLELDGAASKSGSTTNLYVDLAQEGNGALLNQYRVRAVNANGTSPWSSYSNSIDTLPPFFPPYFPPYFPPGFPYFPPYFPPGFPYFPPYFPPGFPYFPPGFPYFPPRFMRIL